MSIPEHMNPSPTVNGSLHVQLKFAVRRPSLVQLAFTSHGSDRQGSGTTGKQQLKIVIKYLEES